MTQLKKLWSGIELMRDFLLVRVLAGSPLKPEPEGGGKIITLTETRRAQVQLSAWAEVLAVGPELKNRDIKSGTCVVYPPTSGFIVPSGDDHEYRIVNEQAVVAVLRARP